MTSVPHSGAKSVTPGGSVAGVLTIRDQFAAAALSGLCGNCDSTGMFSWTPESVADYAYQVADAMLAAKATAGETRNAEGAL